MKRWIDIKGFEGKYQVNNNGEIKSLIPWNGTSERVMKQRFDKDGYLKISLYIGNNKYISFMVHRLVAEEFIKNPMGKKQVNHKNGIKTDNRVENLEWCTNQENRDHAWKTGLVNTIGENHGRAKLTNKDVLDIRKNYNRNNYSSRKIAKKYNMDQSSILDVIHRVTWTHI